MNPLALYGRIAVAEAVTWALLLGGMFLKYVTDTTEVGVQIAGPIHGVVFIAFCLATVLVAVDQRWSPGRLALGILSAIPPFTTIAFHRYAVRQDALASAWRLRSEAPASTGERLIAWLLSNPLRGLLTGLAAVAVLTGAALLAGPPVG